MINKVNSIRIFCILIVLFVICGYQILIRRGEKDVPVQPETKQQSGEEPETETEPPPSVPVAKPLDYKFIIIEEADYLTVYFADQSAVYEYTGIRYSDLPDTLRQKIRKGYCIKDEETLFGFLENYSS